jgi:hypothetical protein
MSISAPVAHLETSLVEELIQEPRHVPHHTEMMATRALFISDLSAAMAVVSRLISRTLSCLCLASTYTRRAKHYCGII